MSLTGKTEAEKLLRGKISKLDVIYTDTYKIAVQNGFDGTVDEWLASIKGEKGDKGDKGDTGAQGKQGVQGEPGKDYVLTKGDKEEIAEQVFEDAKPYIDSYIDMGILEATLEQRGGN